MSRIDTPDGLLAELRSRNLTDDELAAIDPAGLIAVDNLIQQAAGVSPGGIKELLLRKHFSKLLGLVKAVAALPPASAAAPVRGALDFSRNITNAAQNIDAFLRAVVAQPSSDQRREIADLTAQLASERQALASAEAAKDFTAASKARLLAEQDRLKQLIYAALDIRPENAQFFTDLVASLGRKIRDEELYVGLGITSSSATGSSADAQQRKARLEVLKANYESVLSAIALSKTADSSAQSLFQSKTNSVARLEIELAAAETKLADTMLLPLSRVLRLTPPATQAPLPVALSTNSLTSPPSIPDCLAQAKLIAEQITSGSSGDKSPRLTALLAANTAKVQEITEYLRQAEMLLEQQVSSIVTSGVATAPGAYAEFSGKIDGLLKKSQVAFQGVADSRKTYLAEKKKLVVSEKSDARKARETDKTDAQGYARRFDAAIKAYADERGENPDRGFFEKIATAARYGWNAWGYGGDGVTARAAREDYLEKQRTSSYAAGIGRWVLAAVSFIALAFVRVVEAYTYGLSKWAGAFGSGPERSVMKGIIRTAGLLLALGVVPAMVFAAIAITPGVNVVAVIVVGILVVAPLVLSAFNFATRFWQDKRALLDLDPKRGGDYEVTLDDGQTISLNQEKLKQLLLVVSKMERALSDQTRSLSAAERVELKGFRDAIIGCDGAGIQRLLDRLRDLAAERTPLVASSSAGLPERLGDLESQVSKDRRQKTLAVAVASASQAQPPSVVLSSATSRQGLSVAPAPASALSSAISAPLPPPPLVLGRHQTTQRGRSSLGLGRASGGDGGGIWGFGSHDDLVAPRSSDWGDSSTLLGGPSLGLPLSREGGVSSSGASRPGSLALSGMAPGASLASGRIPASSEVTIEAGAEGIVARLLSRS